MADVIADVEPLEDAANEPCGGGSQYRQTRRAALPSAPGELVDFVAGLTSK